MSLKQASMDKCLCVNKEIVFGCAELEEALKQHGCRLIEIGDNLRKGLR